MLTRVLGRRLAEGEGIDPETQDQCDHWQDQ